MPIYDFKLFEYQIDFAQPASIFKKDVHHRTGFIIQLNDASGHVGYGETAPLPSGQTEDPSVVIEQLKGLKGFLKDHPIPHGVEKLDGKFSAYFDKYPLSSSVRFGIESAILSLLADSRNQSLAQLLDPQAQSEIQINRLLHGDKENILSEAAQFLKQGETTLKLKVGQQSLDNDITLVNELATLLAGRAILRLDANQSFTYDDALKFCRSIDYGSIVYIEEPLKDFTRIAELYDEVLIPFAVDESLKHHSLKELKSINGIEVIIIKPTLLGGLERSARLIHEAMNYGLHPVISSCFESGIGIRILANLAAAYAKHTVSGLDTLRWFKEDIVDLPLPINHGRIAIEQTLPHLFKLQTSRLREISC